MARYPVLGHFTWSFVVGGGGEVASLAVGQEVMVDGLADAVRVDLVPGKGKAAT